MSRGAVARNAVHAGLSVAAAAVVAALPPEPAAVVLAAATFVALTVELTRRVSPAVARSFGRLAPMLKDGEGRRLTGATTLSIGFTATAVVFSGTPALAGILFAGLGDPLAAVVGRPWGRLRYPGGKSVIGSATFLAVTVAVGLALGLPPGAALVAALALTAVEALSLPVDDNVYLPVLGAAVVTLVG